jgi:ABC-type antimicrobial peptide transport system permease subunit
MALGAPRAGVIRLVLQSSLVTVAAGAGIGLVLSLALSKVLAAAEHASVRDPVLLLEACAVLFGVTALACLYPAWRAASIDPMQAIRTE